MERKSANFARPAPSPATGKVWAADAGLHEILVEDARDPGGPVFALLAQERAGDRAVLWVQDRLSRLEAGQPFAAGLGAIKPEDLLLARAANARQALWAMEEALKSGAVAAVIGEIWGQPAVLDFTASRRLDHAARAGGAACFLVRFTRARPASAARQRWRVSSLASAPHPHDRQAPGAPRWRLDLIKSRSRLPARWTVEYDLQTNKLHMVAPLADGAVPAASPMRRAGDLAA